MSNPKLGMHYEDVKKRLKRIKNVDGKHVKNHQLQQNLINSLTNQVRLHEGEGAVKELNKELSSNTSSKFSGKYNRSCGFGDGNKDYTGWKYVNGKWKKEYK